MLTLSNAITLAITLLFLLISINQNISNTLFQYHPIVMITVSFLVLPFGILLSRISKKNNYHAFVQLLTVIGTLIGFYVIWRNKENGGRSHFSSWHGISGGIMIGWMVIQYAFGQSFVHYGLKVSDRIGASYHRVSGTLMYFGMLGLCMSGFYKLGQVHHVMTGAATVAIMFYLTWSKKPRKVTK
eukprot:TRINITY_DN6810_c0_g1_i1.p1 TRINITY_DN6810_c0_g1~~TRINITY_DN6810_c0_g1_i1.p1  ORF type:complete len:185 (+),score=9.85 TRINITY_DN6810_c0_g1_i1:252-806(+)